MRVILFFATLAPLFMAGEAGFFRDLFFCRHKCNPHPGEPLKHCLHKCRWKLGKYYDGSECWILGGVGNHFKWKGACKNGICVRSTKGYSGSEAEKHCGPKTTTAISAVTTATTSKALHGSSPDAAGSDHQTAKPNSSLPVTIPPVTANASASAEATSPSNAFSISQVQNVTNTVQEITVASTITQASSDANVSPTTQNQSVTTATGETMDVSSRTPAPSPAISSSATSDENTTTTTEDHTNASVTSSVFLPNDTSSGASAKNDTRTEDTTKANASIPEISTASTLVITEDQSEPTPSAKTTEDSKPGTRTYGPRPDWLNERFRTATTAKITPKANASNEVIVSSTTEATSADSSHILSTRGTETSEPIEKTQTMVTATKATVGENSRDNATMTTTASSTSKMAC